MSSFSDMQRSVLRRNDGALHGDNSAEALGRREVVGALLSHHVRQVVPAHDQRKRLHVVLPDSVVEAAHVLPPIPRPYPHEPPHAERPDDGAPSRVDEE